MKTLATFSTVLALLLASGCRGPSIMAFENEGFAFVRPGDTIMRGTNVVMKVTEQGMYLSKKTIDRVLDVRIKK